MACNLPSAKTIDLNFGGLTNATAYTISYWCLNKEQLSNDDEMMLETIDGGASGRPSINADTSWEPDFEESDFSSNGNGITPNIVTPSDSAVECSFDSWALSDNEMEAINEYSSKEPLLSDVPPPPPKDTDVTARTTNVKTLKSLNSSTHSAGSEGKRQSKLSKAKQKYNKLVKSPKEKEGKRLEEQKAKEEAEATAERRRERREVKKDKFSKWMNKRKDKISSKAEEVSSPEDPKGFDPWMASAKSAEAPPKEDMSEEVSEMWKTAVDWDKDEEEVQGEEVQDVEKHEELGQKQSEDQGEEVQHKVPHTPEKKDSIDAKSQDIFRPKGAPSSLPPVHPSPANKEVNDVLKDLQNNLEVSAITRSSSLVMEDGAEGDFEYDFNLDSTPINVRDRDFQSRIDQKIEGASIAAEEDNDITYQDADDEPAAAAPAGKMAMFSCGSVDVEFVSPKQVMGNLKTGMKNSVRKFFGVCDVGDGVDAVATHVQETKKTWKKNMNETRDHTKDYVAFGVDK